MSRVQLALRVSDLEESVRFYTSLFGVEPAKRRPGYANFAVAEPPLKLVLLEGEPGKTTVMDHLGVEVETPGEVAAATERLAGLGLFTRVEDDTTCCYATQDKVWVHGPGQEPWEVYAVTGDSAVYGTDGAAGAMPDHATDLPADPSTDVPSTDVPAELAATTADGSSACCASITGAGA